MKICYKCGEYNWYMPGEDPDKCKHCEKPVDSAAKVVESNIKGGGRIESKKMLHDEYPWSDGQGR